MVGTAKTHPGARNFLAGQIVFDLAGEQRAPGSEYELGGALVGEAQDFRDMDMAGERERDAIRQLTVKGRQRLLQGRVDGLECERKPHTGRWVRSQLPGAGRMPMNSAA